MTQHVGTSTHRLIVHAGPRLCALPLGEVVEVMRPLPLQPVGGGLPFLAGISVVRGQARPVVDLAALLAVASPPAERFVCLRTGDRRLILAVGGVRGIRRFDEAELAELPPLLREAHGDYADRLALVDGDAAVVLDAGRILPASAWPELAGQLGSP